MQGERSMRSSALFRRRLWRLSGQVRRLCWPQLFTSCVGTSGGRVSQRRRQLLRSSQESLLGAQLGTGRATLGVAQDQGGGRRSSHLGSQTTGSRLSQEQRAGRSSSRTTPPRLLVAHPDAGRFDRTTRSSCWLSSALRRGLAARAGLYFGSRRSQGPGRACSTQRSATGRRPRKRLGTCQQLRRSGVVRGCFSTRQQAGSGSQASPRWSPTAATGLPWSSSPRGY